MDRHGAACAGRKGTNVFVADDPGSEHELVCPRDLFFA
jgi:hypothetical protein